MPTSRTAVARAYSSQVKVTFSTFAVNIDVCKWRKHFITLNLYTLDGRKSWIETAWNWRKKRFTNMIGCKRDRELQRLRKFERREKDKIIITAGSAEFQRYSVIVHFPFSVTMRFLVQKCKLWNNLDVLLLPELHTALIPVKTDVRKNTVREYYMFCKGINYIIY